MHQLILNFSQLINRMYNLPTSKPDLQEIRLIVRELVEIPESQLNEDTLKQVVFKHIRFDKEPLLEGLDMSDLNLLQNQILLVLQRLQKK